MILLVGGQFMEFSGLIVAAAPLVFPIAFEIGIVPMHLGSIMVVTLEIGMITPLVGLNLCITSSVAGMPMTRVAADALSFLSVLLGFLIVVTFTPWVSIGLPTTFMEPEIITYLRSRLSQILSGAPDRQPLCRQRQTVTSRPCR